MIATAIRAHAAPQVHVASPGDDSSSQFARQSARDPARDSEYAGPAVARAQTRREPGAAVHRGTIMFWGEAEFADRKRIGRTYTSFALKLETETGVDTLQGEG
ncbi:hypothetical protein AU476_05450 [Cupriavidus sp. UYMSc13B]|nr:hypothetical protein AU476_05450 [Cupriavidus sp. UYMSc13B]